MPFINEIVSFLKPNNYSNEFLIINLGGVAVYIEGVKQVLNVSVDLVELKSKSKKISVLGNNLVIDELSNQCVTVIGENINVAVEQ